MCSPLLLTKVQVFCHSSRCIHRRTLVFCGVLGRAPLLIHQNPVGEPQEPPHVHVPFLILSPFLPWNQPARAPQVLPPQAHATGPQRTVTWYVNDHLSTRYDKSVCENVIRLDRAVWFVDVTHILSELELLIHRVKVSTTPDGRVVDLFFITDGM